MDALSFLRAKFPLWDVQDRGPFDTVSLRQENLIEAMNEFAEIVNPKLEETDNQKPSNMNLEIMGYKASDKVTGFTGTIVGAIKYLTGCSQYLLQPECDEKLNNLPEARWFDEGRIKLESQEPEIKAEDLAAPINGADYAPPKTRH